MPNPRNCYGAGYWGDCQFDAEAVAVSKVKRGYAFVEPITAALAGISLIKASVSFIKENISTAQDIGQIAGQIDALFMGQKQVQVASNRKSGVGLADQFGVQSVAKEMIDAKLAAEQIAEVARMVDFRFGSGTWASILAERQKRLQEAKEAKLKAKREAQKAHDERIDTIKTWALIIGSIVVMISLFMFLMISVATAFGN
jgi:hypothetical protein